MIYKDMTFCSYYKDCKNAVRCHRPLTPEAKAAAEAWGGPGALIAQYAAKPDCHESAVSTGISEDTNATLAIHI